MSGSAARPVTADDIARIEAALGVSLPESYRRTMVPYPVPAAAGNAELALWDDADRLIEYNVRLRRRTPGEGGPWPPHFYAVGHPQDGSPCAIDLRSPDASVWWVDHANLDEGRMVREGDAFAAWVETYFRELREEMEGEGVDPDGSPAQRAAVEAKNARRGWLGCVATAALLGALVALLKRLF